MGAVHQPLLGESDPAPVELHRPAAAGPFFLTCEHAGRAIPHCLGTLGLAPAELRRHIAWDIGAREVALYLSRLLDATLVAQRYSRLVVDCNRAEHATDLMATRSEATEVPGNRNLDAAQRGRRSVEIYWPYHDAITAALDARDRAGHETVLVSVHSCTPRYLGVERPWHVGVLYEHDPRLGQALMRALADGAGSEALLIGDNQPYRLDHTRDYAVPVHGHARGYLHVELELRQDLIAGTAGQQAWAARLAEALRLAHQRVRG